MSIKTLFCWNVNVQINECRYVIFRSRQGIWCFASKYFEIWYWQYMLDPNSEDCWHVIGTPFLFESEEFCSAGCFTSFSPDWEISNIQKIFYHFFWWKFLKPEDGFFFFFALVVQPFDGWFRMGFPSRATRLQATHVPFSRTSRPWTTLISMLTRYPLTRARFVVFGSTSFGNGMGVWITPLVVHLACYVVEVSVIPRLSYYFLLVACWRRYFRCRRNLSRQICVYRYRCEYIPSVYSWIEWPGQK